MLRPTMPWSQHGLDSASQVLPQSLWRGSTIGATSKADLNELIQYDPLALMPIEQTLEPRQTVADS